MSMPQDVDGDRYASARGEVALFFDRHQTLIELAGEVDLAMAQALDFVAEQATSRPGIVLVDVSRVTFMDSTGLTLLLRVAAFEARCGRRLRVLGAQRRTRDLLQVAGLSNVVDVSPVEAIEADGQRSSGALLCT
jgi:anti-sigma B factor antagonist